MLKPRTAPAPKPPPARPVPPPYGEPLYGGEAPPDSWRAEDVEEALARRYGHLDLDRGVFDALYAPAPRREGMSDGAKGAVAGGVVLALGALAWWLWPSSAPGAAPAMGAQKTAGGVGLAAPVPGTAPHPQSYQPPSQTDIATQQWHAGYAAGHAQGAADENQLLSSLAANPVSHGGITPTLRYPAPPPGHTQAWQNGFNAGYRDGSAHLTPTDRK